MQSFHSFFFSKLILFFFLLPSLGLVAASQSSTASPKTSKRKLAPESPAPASPAAASPVATPFASDTKAEVPLTKKKRRLGLKIVQTAPGNITIDPELGQAWQKKLEETKGQRDTLTFDDFNLTVDSRVSSYKSVKRADAAAPSTVNHFASPELLAKILLNPNTESWKYQNPRSKVMDIMVVVKLEVDFDSPEGPLSKVYKDAKYLKDEWIALTFTWDESAYGSQNPDEAYLLYHACRQSDKQLTQYITKVSATKVNTTISINHDYPSEPYLSIQVKKSGGLFS